MVNNLHHVDGRGCSANNDVRRLGIGNRLPGDDYGSLGVNGGGKVDHMGGSIVGLRLS